MFKFFNQIIKRINCYSKSRKMKLFIKGIIVIALFTIVSCQHSRDNNSAEMAAAESMQEQTANEQVPVTDRKLIKEGDLRFETADIVETRKVIFAAINKYSAYVSSDQEYSSPGRKSNAIVIRVPAKDFDNLLQDASAGVERFEQKDIRVKDVTEEFLDVEARLKTKKELEVRYLELLKKTNSVTEILEVEHQIGDLRAEIESIEGRLNYLKNRVSLSTLSMTFYETVPGQTAFGAKFKDGFRNGWENFVWFFVMLTNIWPFILLTIGIVFGIRIYIARKKKK